MIYHIDPLDPTIGVNYGYINGDNSFCSEGKKRSLTIELTCKDDHYNIPDEEPVYENDCAYKFSIDSVYGCPTGGFSNFCLMNRMWFVT